MSESGLILVDNESFPASSVVLGSVQRLLADGYEVTVVSPNTPSDPELERWVDGVRSLRFPAPSLARGRIAYLRASLLTLLRIGHVLRSLRGAEFETAIVLHKPSDQEPALLRSLRRRALRLLPLVVLRAGVS